MISRRNFVNGAVGLGLLVLGLGLLVPRYLAARNPRGNSVAQTITLTWTAVTTYADSGGTIPSTVPVTYNIYQGATCATVVNVATGVTALTYTINTGLTVGNSYAWTVSASAAGVEGAQSNCGTAF